MMKSCVIFLFTAIAFCSGVAESESGPNAPEQEIRTALCEIENGNFAVAEKTLEKILQKQPQNVYAQRLLPGALAKMIKKDDRSAENAARIRRAVEAFQKFAQNQAMSAEDRAQADEFVLTLIGRIGDEEKTAELLKRVEDKTRTPADRSKYYVMLAYQQYSCADRTLAETPQPAQSAIEKAKNCLSKGLEYADRAIALDEMSDDAWSYKASMLSLSAKIAALEKNPSLKAQRQKEFEQAKKRFKEIVDKERAALNKPKEESSRSLAPQKETSDKELFARELTGYKYEKPLDELVQRVYIPTEFFDLVAPVPPDEPDPSDEPATEASPDERQKREWQVFSPPSDEFSAELPSGVKIDAAGEVIIYETSSEGVKFLILSQAKPAQLPADVTDDAVLNTLAWAIVQPTRNFAMLGNSPTVFEVNFLRKETFGGQPSRIYAYTVSACAGKTDGTIIALVGKKRNYAVRIHGAGERHQSVQRFLKSWKITGGS